MLRQPVTCGNTHFWSGLHGHQSGHFGFWCGLHGHQSGHFSRWCGLHGHHNGHRPFQSLVRPGNLAAQKTGGGSVVTRMSCRGRPAALLSPRGSSSGLFFLGPGRAPGGYSHTPNNTHNRRPSPPRAPLPCSARSGDRREDARRGRRPSKRKTRRGPPRRAMSVLK